VSPDKLVCIAGSSHQDQKIFRHQLREFSDEVTVFDLGVPPPDKFNIIIIDCEHLDEKLSKPLQYLLSLNKTSSLIFIGQLTDTCEFVLTQHSGKIFHLQKGHTFLEDLQEALDEIHVPHPRTEFSMLQKLRSRIFAWYGFASPHA
jgi:hypothetical protein